MRHWPATRTNRRSTKSRFHWNWRSCYEENFTAIAHAGAGRTCVVRNRKFETQHEARLFERQCRRAADYGGRRGFWLRRGQDQLRHYLWGGLLQLEAAGAPNGGAL